MRILSVKQYNCRLKVTIQQTGKLNFTDETAKALGLTAENGVKFFMTEEPEQLCMAIMKVPDEDSFSLRRSGAYFYVTAHLLFDELGVDYRANTVIYDLVRCTAYDKEMGGMCYRMNMRQIKKRNENEEKIDK